MDYGNEMLEVLREARITSPEQLKGKLTRLRQLEADLARIRDMQADLVEELEKAKMPELAIWASTMVNS